MPSQEIIHSINKLHRKSAQVAGELLHRRPRELHQLAWREYNDTTVLIHHNITEINLEEIAEQTKPDQLRSSLLILLQVVENQIDTPHWNMIQEPLLALLICSQIQHHQKIQDLRLHPHKLIGACSYLVRGCSQKWQKEHRHTLIELLNSNHPEMESTLETIITGGMSHSLTQWPGYEQEMQALLEEARQTLSQVR